MSNAGRRELGKERRRNNILNAAEKLFFSKGYDNVSLNEIAKKADLGRSTVYLYFENKEELFFAIVLQGTQILHEMIMNETKKVKTSLEKITAFKKAYHKFANEYPDYLKTYNYLFSGRFDLTNIEHKEYRWGAMADSKYYQEYKKKIDENYFPNFPIPKFTVSEYLNEIIFLRREMFDVLCISTEQGKKEGTIKPNINSFETTILLTLIVNNIDNMPPDLKELLKSQKINHERFLADVGDLIGYMVTDNRNTK